MMRSAEDIERIAELEAHVERMRDVWQRLHLRSPVHVEVLKAYSHVMRDTPTTSLARLKAEWQAEGVHRAVCILESEFDPCHPIIERLEQIEAEERRQAEEAP